MRNNLVREISQGMLRLENLKSIDFGRNKLVSVPEEISNAKALV